MKKLVTILLAITMIFTLAACDDSAAEQESEAPASAETSAATAEQSTETTDADDVGDPVTLVFSTVENSTVPAGLAQKEFAAKVAELSGGNITVECYDSGTLFNATDEKIAVASGDIDLCYGNASSLSTGGSQWLSMYAAAYVFSGYDHLIEVLNGEIGDEIRERFYEERDLVLLSGFYTGMREISLSMDMDVQTPADLAGINLRMPDTTVFMFIGEALGANPTPIAYSELYTALQTGAVDGQDNPLPTVLANKFYEVQKCIIMTDHVVGSGWIVVNGDTWRSLTETQQGWLMEASEYAGKYCDDAVLEIEADAIQSLMDLGLNIYYPDKQAFIDHVSAEYLNDSTITEGWDLDLYREILSLG